MTLGSRYFALLLIALGIHAAEAQTVSGYGVKLGTTAAELHNGTSSDARWGATGSFFATAPLLGVFDVLGEAGYHAKGSRGEDLGIEQRGEFDSRLDYAFLLVAPQYANTLGGSGLQLFAFAGPRADLFLQEDTRYLDGSEEPPPFLSRDFRPFVLGVSAGIGLDFSRLMRVPLIVELRYTGDVTPAYTFSNGDQEVRTRAFDFRLGLSF